MSEITEEQPSRSWRVARAVFSYGVVVVLIVAAGIWLARNWDGFTEAVSLSPVHAVAITPFIFVSLLVIGLTNQVAITHLGAPLRFMQWASLAFASTLANYIFPGRAGAVMRATYFRCCCGFSIAHFASTMAAIYLLTLLTNSLVGVGVLAWYYLYRNVVSWVLVGIFAAVAAMCLLLLWLPLPPLATDHKSRWWRFIARFHEGWNSIRRSPITLGKVLALSIALTGLFVIRLHLAFAATGNHIDLAGCLLIATVTSITTFVAITPAGLGIREAAIVFVSLAVGINVEVSLLAATIDRAAAMAVVAILGPFGMLRISREMAAHTVRQGR